MLCPLPSHSGAGQCRQRLFLSDSLCTAVAVVCQKMPPLPASRSQLGLQFQLLADAYPGEQQVYLGSCYLQGETWVKLQAPGLVAPSWDCVWHVSGE